MIHFYNKIVNQDSLKKSNAVKSNSKERKIKTYLNKLSNNKTKSIILNLTTLKHSKKYKLNQKYQALNYNILSIIKSIPNFHPNNKQLS